MGGVLCLLPPVRFNLLEIAALQALEPERLSTGPREALPQPQGPAARTAAGNRRTENRRAVPPGARTCVHGGGRGPVGPSRRVVVEGRAGGHAAAERRAAIRRAAIPSIPGATASCGRRGIARRCSTRWSRWFTTRCGRRAAVTAIPSSLSRGPGALPPMGRSERARGIDYAAGRHFDRLVGPRLLGGARFRAAAPLVRARHQGLGDRRRCRDRRGHELRGAQPGGRLSASTT